MILFIELQNVSLPHRFVHLYTHTYTCSTQIGVINVCACAFDPACPNLPFIQSMCVNVTVFASSCLFKLTIIASETWHIQRLQLQTLTQAAVGCVAHYISCAHTCTHL